MIGREIVWFIGYAHTENLGKPFHRWARAGETACGQQLMWPRHCDTFRRSIAELFGRPCKRCYPS